MWTAAIIEVEVTAERVPRLANAFVGPQIYLLVFDAAPQPLDEHVVPPCSFAIHADRDAVAGERAGEGRAGELRALVGIADFGLAVTSEGVLQCLDAEARLHRDRQPPRQNPAGCPAENDSEIPEAARHRDGGDVHCPDMLWARNLLPAHHITLTLLPRPRLRVRTPADQPPL